MVEKKLRCPFSRADNLSQSPPPLPPPAGALDLQGLPSAELRGLSLREARKRVRSLKLQLFCTLLGLDASPTCSLLGEVGIGGGARCCLEGPVRFWELLIRMRSLMPIRLLAEQGRPGKESS